MKRTAGIVPVVGLTLALAAACAVGTPGVSVLPPAIAGCEFTVDIVVNAELLDFTGYDLLIDFDETIMSVADVEEGTLPGGYAGATFFYWTDVGTDSNALMINGAVLGGSISGPGVLASVTFRGELNGLSPMSFLTAVFRDLDNLPIDVTDQGGSATVDDQITISVVPDVSNWINGHSFTLELEIGSGVEFVNGMHIEIAYEDTLITYDSASEGTLLAEYEPHANVAFSASGGGGGVVVDASIVGGGSISGPGSVAFLTFNAIDTGESPIDITDADFTRTIIPPIGACLNDGVVIIEAGVVIVPLRWGMIKSLYR